MLSYSDLLCFQSEVMYYLKEIAYSDIHVLKREKSWMFYAFFYSVIQAQTLILSICLNLNPFLLS